jgi:hypothetical protein
MHIIRRTIQAAAFAAVLTTVMAGAAQAQSLGKLGRAAKEKLTQATSSQPSSGSTGSSAAQGSSAAPTGARGTAGFTADQLDRLAQGLSAEIEARRALAAELKTLEARPDYEQCKLNFAMSETGLAASEKFLEVITAHAADSQNPKSQAAMQEAQDKYEAAARKACGPAPDDAERARREKQGEPARRGAEQAGVDAHRYALLKELALPFCAVATGFDAGAEAKIPSGAGKSYSYSAEDTALLKPRCGTLLPLLQATL